MREPVVPEIHVMIAAAGAARPVPHLLRRRAAGSPRFGPSGRSIDRSASPIVPRREGGKDQPPPIKGGNLLPWNAAGSRSLLPAVQNLYTSRETDGREPRNGCAFNPRRRPPREKNSTGDHRRGHPRPREVASILPRLERSRLRELMVGGVRGFGGVAVGVASDCWWEEAERRPGIPPRRPGGGGQVRPGTTTRGGVRSLLVPRCRRRGWRGRGSHQIVAADVGARRIDWPSPRRLLYRFGHPPRGDHVRLACS